MIIISFLNSKNTSDNTKPNSGVYVVSEVVKYNYQADDGSYYREVTYSDGGFRHLQGNLLSSLYFHEFFIIYT